MDHKNRRRGDNRWKNLRRATYGQNYVNSETFGVMRGIEKRGAKYRVRCKVGTRRRCFTVATLAAAQKLHRKLELQQWGEFACIRK